jgi:hypothetical protein
MQSGFAAAYPLLRRPTVEDNAAMEAEPLKVDLPKRKCRWFQFRLPWLLIGVKLLAVACAVILPTRAHCAGPAPSGVQIPSWGELEKEFTKSLALETPPDYGFKNSPTFRRIIDRGDKALWLEMLNQRDHPVVVLAGYLCIRDKFPEQSFKSALRAVGNKPPDSSIMLCAPMIERLNQADPSPKNLKEFSAVCATLEIKRNAGAIWILGGFVPYSFLYKWFDDRASEDVPWSIRACVLDRLYGGAQEQKLPITSRMRESLEAAARVPGIPRLVFLTYTERLDRDFSKAFVQTLADESVDDLAIYPILLNHLPFVREHADELRSLKLSESRKQILERAVDKSIHKAQ